MKKSLFQKALASLDTPEPVPEVQPTAQENKDAPQEQAHDVDIDSLITNGPLASTFTKALNEKYAKDGMSTESQQLDQYRCYAEKKQQKTEDEHLEKTTEPVTYQPVESTAVSAPMTQEEVVKFFNSNDFTDTGITPMVKFTSYDLGTTGIPVQKNKLIFLADPENAQGYVVESIEIVVKTRKANIT